MKKFLYILFSVCILTACSSDDDNPAPNTDPLKGDNISIEQVVGTYEPNRVYFENNSNNGFFEYNQKLTFNSDKTGYDFTYNEDHSPFTWDLSNNIISFTHSKFGNVKAWIKDNKLSFKATYEETSIAIYEYKRVN
ncbi:MAG: hypothetical protein LBV74_21020 [Tannerella sp.]|jgi:hypothetical protein|nr:hypothetical protein [Tannerella sp.]